MEPTVMSESLVVPSNVDKTVTQVLTQLVFCVFKSHKDVSIVISSATPGTPKQSVVRMMENLKTMLALQTRFF